MSKHEYIHSLIIKQKNDELQKALINGEVQADEPFPEPEFGNNTPLHFAAYNKKTETLNILLDSLKAEPNRLKQALQKTNLFNVTPIFEAILINMPPDDYIN